MFSKSKILIQVVVVFILISMFSSQIEARRVKDVKYPASSLAFSSYNSAIGEARDITDPIYPYPVITTSHPLLLIPFVTFTTLHSSN